MTEDEVGRRSPYEVVFSIDGLERAFATIEGEGRTLRADLSRREQFARLAAVGDLLARLVPGSFETGALDRYLEIVFHGFHFWRAGRPFYAFEEGVVRSLIERPPDLSGRTLDLPHPAQYMELPRNLLWAAVTDGPPEPLEGLFARALDGPGGTEVLCVLGMWPERPGFSAAGLTFPAGVPLVAGDEAFRSDLPGADLAGLYSLRSAGEAIALLARLVWYIEAFPAAVVRVPASRAGQGDQIRHLTSLEHLRVRSVEERGAG
jgi:hypothetical protein